MTAALEKLPASATHKKYFSCFSSTHPPTSSALFADMFKPRAGCRDYSCYSLCVIWHGLGHRDRVKHKERPLMSPWERRQDTRLR
jgi:hypothetical protein